MDYNYITKLRKVAADYNNLWGEVSPESPGVLYHDRAALQEYRRRLEEAKAAGKSLYEVDLPAFGPYQQALDAEMKAANSEGRDFRVPPVIAEKHRILREIANGRANSGNQRAVPAGRAPIQQQPSTPVVAPSPAYTTAQPSQSTAATTYPQVAQAMKTNMAGNTPAPQQAQQPARPSYPMVMRNVFADNEPQQQPPKAAPNQGSSYMVMAK